MTLGRGADATGDRGGAGVPEAVIDGAGWQVSVRESLERVEEVQPPRGRDAVQERARFSRPDPHLRERAWDVLVEHPLERQAEGGVTEVVVRDSDCLVNSGIKGGSRISR